MVRALALAALLAIGCTQAPVGITPAEEARRAMIEGRSALECGDLSRAFARLDASIAILPTSEAYRFRAVAFVRKNDFAGASRDIEDGVQLDPNNAKLNDLKAKVKAAVTEETKRLLAEEQEFLERQKAP